MTRALRFLAFALLAVPAAMAFAQAKPDPTFEIRTYRVEGTSLLTPQETDAVLAPFTGPKRSLADIQKAREALEAAYAGKGYGAIQVVLPEQEIAKGEVVLRVLEAKVGKVTIEGNRFFDEANIRASLPALVPGQAPNTQRLANNLRVANENPAKQTTVTLRSGGAEGEVDAAVRVTDQSPHKFLVSADNTGTPQTGFYRVGVGYQYANLWNRDHVVNVQYVTSPDNVENVTIVGGSYRIPIYQWGDSFDLIAGYANVNSGQVQNIFNVTGAGRVYAARYNFGLPRWRELEQKLSLGFDVRYYDNNVVPIGSFERLVPDYVLHPLSLTYSGVYRGASTESSGYLSLVQNIPGGANGDQAQFDSVRPGAPASYFLQRAGYNYLLSLPRDFQFRFNVSGQYTNDKLVAAEQFGIGGQDSVRGFYEREFVNDKGYRGTFEAYTPDVGNRTTWSGSRIRFLAFYDWGTVTRVDPQVLELARTGIGSAGIGVRIFYGTSLSVRADYAYVLDGAGTTPSGSSHGNFSVVYAF